MLNIPNSISLNISNKNNDSPYQSYYMIKQSLQKISKLLRDRVYTAPQILCKLYALLLVFGERIDEKDAEFNVVALFSEAHRLIKRYLVDQPFMLTKLTTVKLAQANISDSMQSFNDIIRLRDLMLKNFMACLPKDQIGRTIVEEMKNYSWAGKLKTVFNQAQEIKKQLQKNKKCNEVLKCSQMTVMFWYRHFKGEYLVHLNVFLQNFHQFAKDYIPILKFINHYSNKALSTLCDPEQRYYLTIQNCDQLFLKLREPHILQQLWDQTLQKLEYQPIQSKHKLNLKLMIGQKLIERIVVSGKLVNVDGSQKMVKMVKMVPVVMVGSGIDCDLAINSKYVSRKQMLIIEEEKEMYQSDQQARFFSIVCLSQTNFTSAKYPKRKKAHVGSIFYKGDVKYQIIQIRKENTEQAKAEEQDKTLSLLPGQKDNSQANHKTQNISFLILSGQDKQKQISLSSHLLSAITEIDKHAYNIQQCLQYDQCFFIKAGVKILLKMSNQILDNRPSRKIKLSKGINICLQQYSLVVE